VDRVYFLVKDPYWTVAIWEVAPETFMRPEFSNSQFMLRVHDITGVVFDGFNSQSHFDIQITGNPDHWYFPVPAAGRVYCVELGFRSPLGHFVTVARSNPMQTPPDAPSQNREVSWSRIEIG
jgi:uncharacterized protein